MAPLTWQALKDAIANLSRMKTEAQSFQANNQWLINQAYSQKNQPTRSDIAPALAVIPWVWPAYEASTMLPKVWTALSWLWKLWAAYESGKKALGLWSFEAARIYDATKWSERKSTQDQSNPYSGLSTDWNSWVMGTVSRGWWQAPGNIPNTNIPYAKPTTDIPPKTSDLLTQLKNNLPAKWWGGGWWATQWWTTIPPLAAATSTIPGWSISNDIIPTPIAPWLSQAVKANIGSGSTWSGTWTTEKMLVVNKPTAGIW